ncbi:hypothetical protein ACHAXT_002069 [Thalassiosira profunda]
MDHSDDKRTSGVGPLGLPPSSTMMTVATAADAADGHAGPGRRRRCCSWVDDGAVGAPFSSACLPSAIGAPCRRRIANGRGGTYPDVDVHRRKRRRTTTRQIPSTDHRFAMLMALLALAFLGSASALGGSAAPPRRRALQVSDAQFWSNAPACEERENKGQCEKDAQGNPGDLECLWTGQRCITLPIPGVTQPTPPSVSPAPSPPTRPPTAKPTARPTRPPTTIRPTATPEPTDVPSGSPSGAPTRRPTRKPTMSPSRSPSKAPTPPPTNQPTKRPSSSPSVMPSAEPSVSPSGHPSAPPTVEPSAPPTLSPSKSPTPSPTKKSSPGTPTPTTTAPTSPKPTDQNRMYTVDSVMTLNGLGEKMDGDAEEAWIDVTQDRIRYKTEGIIGDDAGSDLVVTVSVAKQEASSGRRMEGMLITRYGSFEFDDTQQQHRNLRRSQSASLQIDYTTNISFNSDEEWDDQVNDMVADGFRTPAQQEEYIGLLQAADSSTFDSVNSMTLEVDGELVTETEDSNKLKSGDNTMWIAIGCAVGGALFLIAAVVVGSRSYGRNRGGNAAQKQSKSSLPQDRTASGAFPTSPPREAFRPASSQPSPTTTQGYFGTIESREGEDDVSTLGDPYIGEVSAEPRADQTVAESMISSEQEMYVFGVGRERLMTGGSSTAPSKHGMESTATGAHSNPSRMMFGEDPTLEDAFQGSPLPYENPSALQRLSVVAPAGKLGIVIDNQTGDMPMVHAIKETSPLNGKLNCGDLLISVDGIDCRGMTAVQVSRLISSRSHHEARTLIVLRGAGSC